ncbi:hypothetical protein ACFSKM_16020 [Ancylobacter dichloromethanicus]|uniref:Uncharacterized protein n=1 Tax=Ancylobacter dichloromethanicus TaxID=518825 RepID=A0A9W6JDH6_9HYPH|nr:hypothetical protein GCM10017643_37160 [Ancylobacter dichloromethanicus]
MIERKDLRCIRGLPYDLGTLRVVLPNDLPVIKKLEFRSLQRPMKQFETAYIELSPGLIEVALPRVIDHNVPMFHHRPVMRAVVAVTVTASEDLAVAIERRLYGFREVGESSMGR